jgi:hypothetical protein
LSGAPASTHLRTSFSGGASEDGAFQNVLAALYANLMIIDLDDVNNRLQVGLPEGHRSSAELIAHTTAEPLNERGVDWNCGSNLSLGRLKRSLCAVAIGLEAVEPILEYVI